MEGTCNIHGINAHKILARKPKETTWET